MESPLHLAAVGRVAPARRGIIGAAHLLDAAVRSLHDAGAGDEVRIAQAHLAPGSEPEELLRRVLEEVVALDPELPREGNAARAGARVLRIVHGLELLDTILRIVLDHELQRPQHGHRARRRAIELVAHGGLELLDLEHLLAPGDARAFAEAPDRRGRDPAPPHSTQRGQPWIVPARDAPLLDQPAQETLAEHGVRQAERRRTRSGRGRLSTSPSTSSQS